MLEFVLEISLLNMRCLSMLKIVQILVVCGETSYKNNKLVSGGDFYCLDP